MQFLLLGMECLAVLRMVRIEGFPKGGIEICDLLKRKQYFLFVNKE